MLTAVVSKVNECIAKPDRGRLFAVVSFQERQFKITEDDLISTTCANPLPLGATIQLEKVFKFLYFYTIPTLLTCVFTYMLYFIFHTLFD